MKDRSYSCTVHRAHSCFKEWLLKLALLYEDGLIDYSAVSYETSKAGKPHLQAFIVFNESDYYDDYKNPIDWRFQYNTPALNDGVIYYH